MPTYTVLLSRNLPESAYTAEPRVRTPESAYSTLAPPDRMYSTLPSA